MSLAAVTHQSWLFSPPLELPLQARLENGRFDSLRPRPLTAPPLCATGQVIAADDPQNPTGRDVHFSNGLHQAVNLASVAGNCVYAAYSGRVVKVASQPGGRTANISIDPTRALYAWERQLAGDEPLAGPRVPIAVGVTRVNTVHFFFARLEDGVALHVPMYEPMTEDERLLVGLLRDAHRRRDALDLSFRSSSFWGLDVVTQAELAS